MFSTQSLPVENILLHQAAYNGNINEVRLLLNVKTDINIKDKKGFTALHFAVYSGHLDVVKLLISKEANIHARTIVFPKINDKGIIKYLSYNGI